VFDSFGDPTGSDVLFTDRRRALISISGGAPTLRCPAPPIRYGDDKFNANASHPEKPKRLETLENYAQTNRRTRRITRRHAETRFDVRLIEA